MRHLIPSYIRVPVVFFAIAGLIEYFIDSGDKPAFMEQPVILLFLLLVLLFLVAIEGIVGTMDNILYQSLDEEGKARYHYAFFIWFWQHWPIYEQSLGSLDCRGNEWLH